MKKKHFITNYTENLKSGDCDGNNLNQARSNSLKGTMSSKRLKKHIWGTRERAAMSFLIVIAFFVVFSIIILTEIFMIDDRAHNGFMLRSGNSGYSNRLGDSMPDYDNVKDDYDLYAADLLNDPKFGFVHLQDNKYRIQDVDSNGGGGVNSASDSNNGHLSGVLINSNIAHSGKYSANSIASDSRSASLVSGGSASLASWGKRLPKKIEESLPHYPFGMIPTDGSWQIVNGTRFKFFVFSAFYDRRYNGKFLRVIGATKTRGPERVWCRLWYAPIIRNTTTSNNHDKQSQYKSVTVMARVKMISENWNLKYSACFVLCPILTAEYGVPKYVSVVARLRAPPGNLLLLRNTDWDLDFQQKNNITLLINSNSAIIRANTLPSLHDERMSDKLAICVKPFHFDYDQALFLIEYLEFYALLGVSHFTFYNHTIGRQANCVLQHYIKGDIPDTFSQAADVTMERHKDNATLTQSESTLKGNEQQRKRYDYKKPTIQMLPWNLRMRSQKEIRTEGLFAALNDCLYRTMYRYKYMALVDLDEFIVPRNNDTLIELINSLNGRFRNYNTGAYSFQNAFFYLQFGDDPLAAQAVENESKEITQLRAALITQRKTRRRLKLHPQKQRSKYICKPETVVEAGNHFVWEFLPGKSSFNVPPTEAILQHYRVCEFGGNDCIKAPSMLDRTATKYVKILVERVYEVYKYLKIKCKLPELPPLPNINTPPRRVMTPIIRSMNEATTEQKVSKADRKEHYNENQSKIPNIIYDMVHPKKTTTTSHKVEIKLNTTKEKTFLEVPWFSNKTRTKPTIITNTKTIVNRTINATLTVSGLAKVKTVAVTKAYLSVEKATAIALAPDNKNNSLFNKRKRKVVIFFVDAQGQPRARVEYH